MVQFCATLPGNLLKLNFSFSKQLWYIPLTITTDTGKKVTHWMKREKQSNKNL